MGLAEGGKITLEEARGKIGVSYRQAKRIRRALRAKEVKGIIHRNTGHCIELNDNKLIKKWWKLREKIT